MKMSPKTVILAVFVCATALAAAFATGSLAQPFGRQPAKPAPARPAVDDARPAYRGERFVRLLYRGFLYREPSVNEVRGWVRRLDEGARPIELVRSFMDSDEYFVRATYRGLLGREPDPDGIERYQRMLRNGRSRAEMVDEILRSPEFRKRLQ